jgi:predicted ATP-grasp superfamily ATP-dependent carboligase
MKERSSPTTRRGRRPLFILGGDETGLAVARNAARLGLRPVLIARPHDISVWSRLTTCLLVDEFGGADSLAILLTFAATGGRPPLVATNDPWLRFVMAHRAALDERFTVLHPGNEILDLCLNKRRFAEWGYAVGLPTPALVDVPPDVHLSPSAAKSLSFPLFLRPQWSNQAPSSVPKASPVADAEELLTSIRVFEASGTPWVATRSILADAREQYSVAVALRGAECLSFVSQKLRPWPEQCAVGSYVALRPHAGAESLARTALRLMKFDFGIAEVEIIGTRTGEMVVIEVNPRPWSQFALSYRSGHDFLEFLLDPTSPVPRVRRRDGLAWIAFGNDLFVCFSRSTGLVRHSQLGILQYLRSLARVRVFSRFTINDPYPAVRHMIPAGSIRRLRGRPSIDHRIVDSAPW